MFYAIAVSKSDIYGGVRLFKALYVKTALLLLIRWDTTIHLSLWNISTDGVLWSTLK